MAALDTACLIMDDDLLNFSDDDDDYDKTKLPSIPVSRDYTSPLPEFAEEELEWLSNKDAFPAVETCLDIISDHRGIFSSHQSHLSPVSVLENSTSSSNNSTITSYCGALQVPVSFPVRRRSKRRQRRRGFPELARQQGWCQNIKNVKQDQLKPSLSSQSVTSVVAIGRRCQHCLAEKTTQWRAGPMGPKTLCNACGVRYKSGRLVPEYRPASSPTFSSELHSNSHRKIMEKRRKSQVGEMIVNGVCGHRVG